ncbi:putative ABC transport system permease protein [Lachnotalea glycerini]|uniref:Putative ABC transport system permease protein n=1 Tax=Lachnotalea glycerini TaxID=1763509 RepID=A0A318EPL5_9FIRM|nr:ABC transporter permease [Lachnotalea glycerini]PXV91128.1 putative ABC transport system permease protein [Lachnotalea glycerini]
MGKNLYMKLALTNMKKNKDMVLPYLIANTIIAGMYFLVIAMLNNKGLKDIPSSGSLVQCFQISNFIISIIAVIFMVYVNSFLIKKRLKEFGLYNILGLEKKHIIYVMLTENIILFGAAILSGMLFGIIFGKLMFLVLLKICHTSAETRFLLSITPFIQTLKLFGIIFVFCSFINSITILRNKTIDLLQRAKYGEKKMRGLIPLTILGLVLLAIAYYKANKIDNYVQAIEVFFPAVLMVMIATYLLFMTGSIVLLNILKKNKSFYYKSNNFISTSSLIYRMKQNAVGLANICILSTMAIVTAAGCMSLYLGQETIIKQFNPFDMMLNKQAEPIQEAAIRELADQYQIEIDDYVEYEATVGSFVLEDNKVQKIDQNIQNMDFSQLYDFVAISETEYNKACNTNLSLEENHVILASLDDLAKLREGLDAVGKMYQVDDIITESPLLKCKNSNRTNFIYLIFSNDEEALAFTNQVYESRYDTNEIKSYQYINYQGEENDKLLFATFVTKLSDANSTASSVDTFRVKAYGMYGGLLFIGILFIIIFLTITILIIYFKQVTEGFDDRERFVILQKVGMDEKMVKQVINRQIIIVFFIPLIMALIHLLAASNIIKALLTAFYMVDMELVLKCIAGTSALFAVTYVVVYKMTAKVYLRIVKF